MPTQILIVEEKSKHYYSQLVSILFCDQYDFVLVFGDNWGNKIDECNESG